MRRLRLGLLLALLLGMSGAAMAAAAAQAVPVRVGNHRGFGRVVFDFPRMTRYRLSMRNDRVVLHVAGGDAIGQPAWLPRNVRAIAGGIGQAEIDVAPGAHIRRMRVGDHVVIDVLDPVRHASLPVQHSLPLPPPAPPVPRAVVQPVLQQVLPPMGATTASRQAAAGASVVGPAVMAEPPYSATEGRSAPMALAARPAGAATISLPFGRGVAAAAFRRGGQGIVVFDVARPIDMSPLAADPVFGAARIHLLPDATVLRVKLGWTQAIRLSPDSGGWTVTVAAAPLARVAVIPVVSAGRVRLRLLDPGRVVVVPDPVTGANLLVGTQRLPGGARPQGVAVVRRWPGFSVLRSWQGVAVSAVSDRLALRRVADGFRLGAGEPGAGLPISVPARGAALAAADLTRRFVIPVGPRARLQRRVLAELDAAAAAPPMARTRPRIAQARALIALGMGPEALGPLRLAAAEDPVAANLPDVIGLGGIAAFLAGRWAQAARLDDPRLSGTDDVTLWRAALLATRQPGSPAAAAMFAATAALIPTYPAGLRAALAPLAAETMVEGGQPAAAGGLIRSLPHDPALALAGAMLAQARGHARRALAKYDAIAQGADRRQSARAAMRAVLLRVKTGVLTAPAAADALDRQLYAWRGPHHELTLRLHLAALRAQAGQWRQALALLRRSAALFPARKGLIEARRATLFKAMLQSRALATLSPLDVVAIASENAALAGNAAAGRALDRQLAQRLVALDLPDRAVPVLRKLMAEAPPGERRARYGAQLAGMRLEQGDPAAALDALAASAVVPLPRKLSERRTLLFARASVAQGDRAGAVAALAALGTQAADDLRAHILAQAKDWPGAAQALNALAARALPPAGPLDAAQRNIVVRLATATSRVGGQPALDRLRARYGARMGTGPAADMVRLLTGPSIRSVADLPRVAGEIALARTIPAALRAIGAAGAGH